ncbi:MAG: Oxidoreductase [Alyxoria varia]|nr:MAG: Oxidoreductase [Alyxoria varia]
MPSLRERIARVRQQDDPLSLAESFSVGRRDRQSALAGGPAPSASLRQPAIDHSNASPARSLESSSAPSSTTPPQATASDGPVSASTEQSSDPGDPQELEQEADAQGAFNPETGEINWDCPCLGGMAHGTCGPEFKDAFSCFVWSKEEQKGIDCIDKFKAMQDCFRAHPDEYAEELAADPTEDDAADSAMAEPGAGSAQPTSDATNPPSSPRSQQSPTYSETRLGSDPAPAPYSGATSPSSEVPGSNLTSTPSASPTSLSSSTEIPSSAASKQEADQKREFRANGAKATN